MKSKLGFHSGPTGSLTGIGNFWQQLDAAGISIFHKASDSYGPLFEISNLPNPHNVEHHLVYRLSTAGQRDDFDYDVPLYHLTAKQAAVQHWQATKNKLPSEFNKQKVWIEIVNEVDKNRSDWIGRFSVEIAIIANAEGYKILSPGWSSGEPEPIHWQTPGMLAYLMYCEQFPTMAAISIHEYDFGLAGYNAVYPYHYGRFQWCFDVCDKNNISRPNIYVTEWGWALNQVPTWNNALDTINKINQLYAKYPQIKGAAIWNLDGGWGSVNNQLLQYIQPLATYTLQNNFIEGSINEPLDPNYFEDNTMACECNIPNVKTTSIWIPQYDQMTGEELNQAVGWAMNGFPLPDGTKTAGGHMLCPSHVDALRIHTQGLAGSVLGIAYPNKIGTGVTTEWLHQNCPGVFCDNKQVVFLGHSAFQFDHVPVIFR